MAMRQRAVDRQGKAARRGALLDAAERLFEADPTKAPSVAEVAGAAGVAKGTVYLYFASKECLMLALHERQVEAFFGALAEFLDREPLPRIDDVSERALAWLAGHPAFIALAAQVHRVRGQTAQAAVADMACTGGADLAAAAAKRLMRCAQAHDAANSRALLWQSLALVVGLAQLGRPQDVASGMRTLWRGFGAPGAPGEARASAAPAQGVHAGDAAW